MKVRSAGAGAGAGRDNLRCFTDAFELFTESSPPGALSTVLYKRLQYRGGRWITIIFKSVTHIELTKL